MRWHNLNSGADYIIAYGMAAFALFILFSFSCVLLKGNKKLIDKVVEGEKGGK